MSTKTTLLQLESSFQLVIESPPGLLVEYSSVLVGLVSSSRVVVTFPRSDKSVPFLEANLDQVSANWKSVVVEKWSRHILYSWKVFNDLQAQVSANFRVHRDGLVIATCDPLSEKSGGLCVDSAALRNFELMVSDLNSTRQLKFRYPHAKTVNFDLVLCLDDEVIPRCKTTNLCMEARPLADQRSVIIHGKPNENNEITAGPLTIHSSLAVPGDRIAIKFGHHMQEILSQVSSLKPASTQNELLSRGGAHQTVGQHLSACACFLGVVTTSQSFGSIEVQGLSRFRESLSCLPLPEEKVVRDFANKLAHVLRGRPQRELWHSLAEALTAALD